MRQPRSPVRRYEHGADGARAVLVVGSLLDQVFDNAVRFVDMFQGAMPQSMGKLVTFFFRDVVMRLVKQFERPVVAASVSEMRIDRRMVIQILTIVNRRVLDLGDGFVDLGDGVIFLSIHPAGPCLALQMSPRMAQVGEGVEVCGMPSRFIGEGQCGAESKKQRDYSAMSYGFHSLL